MQPASDFPVVIVLAAGRGERFAASGGKVHKLQARLAGKPVIEHVMDAVRASGLEFHVVGAHVSRPGMGDSIASGVNATPDAAGWLILPADLPLIRAETLMAMARCAEGAVAVPLFQGQKGHPVRFSAACRADLLNLKGNGGAAHVVKAHAAMNSVVFVPVEDAGTVTDIDTVQDLARAEAWLAAR